jgi:hypothetical protein
MYVIGVWKPSSIGMEGCVKIWNQSVKSFGDIGICTNGYIFIHIDLGVKDSCCCVFKELGILPLYSQ